MAKVTKMCARCVSDVPAVDDVPLSYRGCAYRLALCERHADLLQTDMWGWLRLAEALDEPDIQIDREFGGEVLASYVAIPRPVRVPDGPEKQDVSDADDPFADAVILPAPPVRGFAQVGQVGQVGQDSTHLSEHVLKPIFTPAVPGEDEWRMTEHAVERGAQRLVSREDAVRAANAPTMTMRPAHDGTQVRIRGHIKVVVNPHTKEIITVSRRNQ